MKKNWLLLCTLILLLTTSNAFAYNMLISDTVGVINTVGSYNIINNYDGSGGVYDGDYFGYLGDDEYTGYYIGTALEVNTEQALNDIINYYLGYSLDFYEYKVEVNNESTDTSYTSDTNGPLTVTWDSSFMSGTWTFSKESGIELGFYAVKGGNDFALYFVDPSSPTGTWTTAHLLNKNGNPEISHFSAAAPVPEPATMLLLGTGLIGLAGLGRRRFLK